MSTHDDKRADILVKTADPIVSPFIFVPHGADPPHDWLAAHEQWIRIPAMFVPHASRGASDPAMLLKPDLSAATGPGLERLAGQARAASPLMWLASARAPDRTPSKPVADVAPAPDDNHAEGTPRTKHASEGNDPGFPPLPNAPMQQGRTVAKPNTAPPSTPDGTAVVPPIGAPPVVNGVHNVTLPDGRWIIDHHSPTGYLQAPTADLNAVATSGAAYRVPEEEDENYGQFDATLLAALLALGHAGTFDFQRSGNLLSGYIQHREFRDVSNFNVGLWCYQAGLTLDETLDGLNRFGTGFSSNRGSSDWQRTIEWVKIGFAFGEDYGKLLPEAGP